MLFLSLLVNLDQRCQKYRYMGFFSNVRLSNRCTDDANEKQRVYRSIIQTDFRFYDKFSDILNIININKIYIINNKIYKNENRKK